MLFEGLVLIYRTNTWVARILIYIAVVCIEYGGYCSLIYQVESKGIINIHVEVELLPKVTSK